MDTGTEPDSSRILTPKNLAIMVQCGNVSVGMDTNMWHTSIWKFNTFFVTVNISP